MNTRTIKLIQQQTERRVAKRKKSTWLPDAGTERIRPVYLGTLAHILPPDMELKDGPLLIDMGTLKHPLRYLGTSFRSVVTASIPEPSLASYNKWHALPQRLPSFSIGTITANTL